MTIYLFPTANILLPALTAITPTSPVADKVFPVIASKFAERSFYEDDLDEAWFINKYYGWFNSGLTNYGKIQFNQNQELYIQAMINVATIVT